VIDTATGELAGFGAASPIQRGPTLNLWRAPTDNDTLQLIFGATDRALPLWQRLGLAHLRRRLDSAGAVADASGAQAVEVSYAATGRERWEDVRATHTYVLLDDGTLRITTHVQVAPDLVDLPRVGLRLQLRPELERLEWYGRGPWDNYSDRKASSAVGRYSSTVTEQYVPYIMPQEHGHKTDVRWLRLTDAQGHGLEVSGDGLFEFNALRHSDEDLATAKHTPDLTARPEVFLSLDHGMRGLGTGLGMDTLPEYRLNASEYSFTFNLKLI
jgi:beta-galactosidase